MFDWKKVKQINGFTSEIINTEDLTTSDFVKQLRNELNLSQRLFAKILGVSEKTVEKWEQGVNPVKGPTSKLLYLLSKHKHLLNDLYAIEGTLEKTNTDYKSYFDDIMFDQFFWFNKQQYKSNSDSKHFMA